MASSGTATRASVAIVAPTNRALNFCGTTTISGARTSKANCCEVSARATSTPAQTHRSRRTLARAPRASPVAMMSCGWKNCSSGIHTGGAHASMTSAAGSHRQRPRPHARKRATAPAISTSQATYPSWSVCEVAPERSDHRYMATRAVEQPGPRALCDGNAAVVTYTCYRSQPPRHERPQWSDKRARRVCRREVEGTPRGIGAGQVAMGDGPCRVGGLGGITYVWPPQYPDQTDEEERRHQPPQDAVRSGQGTVKPGEPRFPMCGMMDFRHER